MQQPLEGEHIPARVPGKALAPQRLRLGKAIDIRRELARIYGLMMRGELDTDRARAGGFLLRTMLESIRIDEIESRLAKLEKEIGK